MIESLTLLIILLVSWSSVFLGKKLGMIAKEEVDAGKRNLAILHNILFILAIVIFFTTNISITEKTIFAIAIIILALISQSNYAILGLIFGVNPTFLLGSIIFLYGFPAGSLMYKNSYKKIIKKTHLFLILGIIGLLIKSYVLL